MDVGPLSNMVLAGTRTQVFQLHGSCSFHYSEPVTEEGMVKRVLQLVLTKDGPAQGWPVRRPVNYTVQLLWPQQCMDSAWNILLCSLQSSFWRPIFHIYNMILLKESINAMDPLQPSGPLPQNHCFTSYKHSLQKTLDFSRSIKKKYSS